VPTQLPALIFDLDGTLTDSKPGIVSCLQKVIDARNLGDQGPLERFVGPPVEEWTVELLPHASEEERAALAGDYRACYDREGWCNNSVYAGVREMLVELQGRGFPLYVCTSKHHKFAGRILDLFELTPFFAAVYGDRLEYASHRKQDLLGLLLREQGLQRDAAWMVGDRIFDIDAAHANEVRCLAAGWGYGSAEECALADAVAATPGDVAKIVAARRAGGDGLHGAQAVAV
jgi:phosphoglycolate phosphatase